MVAEHFVEGVQEVEAETEIMRSDLDRRVEKKKLARALQSKKLPFLLKKTQLF